MGVTRTIQPGEEGTGPSPKSGDTIVMEYTGYLYDESKKDKRGNQFDSTTGRGPFKTVIGEGKVIKGWDDGILGSKEPGGPSEPMKKGGKAQLVITSDYGYGDRGFPGIIPPGATLLFDVELKDFQ